MVKEVPLCVCVCWGVVALSASAFFACLSLLWIPASCQSATVRARVFVLACMLPSEDFVESAVQCQWHIERAWWESPGYVALCLLHLFTPQNTLEFITPLTLSLLFPSICFFFSLFYISPWFPADFFWLVISNQLLSSGGVSVDSQGSFPLCRGQDWVLYHSHWTRSVLYFYFHVFK